MTIYASTSPVGRYSMQHLLEWKHMRRYPGHVLPISDFTDETLGEGSDLLEWGTSAFSVMACKRPLYLQVSQPPQRSHRTIFS